MYARDSKYMRKPPGSSILPLSSPPVIPTYRLAEAMDSTPSQDAVLVPPDGRAARPEHLRYLASAYSAQLHLHCARW